MTKEELKASVLSGLSEIDLGEVFQLYSTLSKKQFLASDLGLSASNYQQWKELEITPPIKGDIKADKKRSWVRLDFIEYCWMKMVISLRELGYPYADIKRVRDYLFENVELDASINTKKGRPERTRNLIDFYSSDALSPALKEIMEEVMGHPEVVDKISSIFASRCRRLDLIIFEAINNKQMEVGLGFFQGGECTPFNWNIFLTVDHWSNDYSREDLLNDTIRRPHVYISITRLIMAFITEAEKEGRDLAFSLLNNDELTVLRELRNKEWKNITVNYDKYKGSKIIKTEKETKIKDSEVKDFIENMIFSTDTEIIIKKTNNGELIINSTRKKKLSQ
jgi:hypothetical protein